MPYKAASHSGEPTLADLIAAVWRARVAILAGCAAGAFVAVIVVMLSTPLYRGMMIVAPADGYALGDYASSAASGGEGLTIPFWRPREEDGVSTDFHRFVYTIKGTAAAAILLKDPAVVDGIARDGGWNAGADVASPEAFAAYLDRALKIEQLGATPLRRISYRHPDPAFAAALLRKIHLVADQMIRRDRRRQSEARIAYLKDSLLATPNPDQRRGIADLLTQQEHVRMLANLDEPYAAIVVEPPSASPKPVWPDALLLVLALTLAGGIAGYVAVAIHARVRAQKSDNAFVHD